MPTGKLNLSAGVLLVKDAIAAANHYRDALGFEQEVAMGDPAVFFILHRDGCRLMLRQAEDPAHVIPLWTVSDKLCSIQDLDGHDIGFGEIMGGAE